MTDKYSKIFNKTKNCKSIPTNIRKYTRIKNEIKNKVKTWPSAYASGQVVKKYKASGGKYKKKCKNSFGNFIMSFFNMFKLT